MPRPFIPAAHTASVEMIWQVNGETVENVFHVTKTTDYTLTDLQGVRDIADVWDRDHMCNYRANGSTLNRIRTKALHAPSAPVEDFGLTTPRLGTQGAQPFPNNVSLCFKLATGLTGRSYRGRWYLVAIPLNFYGATTNQFSPSILATVTSIMEMLRTSLDAGGHKMAVVSYMKDGAWRAGAVVTPITNIVAVDNYFDSQRRRLATRGI